MIPLTLLLKKVLVMVESVGTGPSAHMPTWAGAIPSIYTNWGKITLRERPGGPGV